MLFLNLARNPCFHSVTSRGAYNAQVLSNFIFRSYWINSHLQSTRSLYLAFRSIWCHLWPNLFRLGTPEVYSSGVVNSEKENDCKKSPVSTSPNWIIWLTVMVYHSHRLGRTYAKHILNGSHFFYRATCIVFSFSDQWTSPVNTFLCFEIVQFCSILPSSEAKKARNDIFD